MKIAGVNFPEPLLNALQDNRLVVFAGAGVSMGPPAILPNFKQLAERVAEGTGQSIARTETEDRFLGRLHDNGVDVHRRAAETLQKDSLEPTAIHRHLLRCYAGPEEIRVVTTNFDTLFEAASDSEFISRPRIFQAPAPPLGSRFQGIVHLHGAVNEPEAMVLTHRDFGRAYLTEADGWARRFLVDLFASYTTLFVGYSHSDTIMTYLTPSLPPDDEHGRFALIGDPGDEQERWLQLGIQPVVFRQDHADDFRGLEAAVRGLADYFRRGILDWQRDISAIASRPPPVDEESAGVIDHALTTSEYARFFVESAELPEWIDWLDRRGHLDCLFPERETTQQVATLSHWLAKKFAATDPDAVFAFLTKQRGNISFELWLELAWAVGNQDSNTPTDIATITKWVHFLISSMPPTTHEGIMHSLRELAETCSNQGAFQSLLQLYDAMTKPRNELYPAQEYGNYAVMYQYHMKELRERNLEPNLEHIAHSLLDRTTVRLEERHSLIAAWKQSTPSWDADSYLRSAIEPHKQDNMTRRVDNLIDIARGCLEWLAVKDPSYIGTWCNRFAGSETPLLRRMATHAMSARTDLSANGKIAWLLERCDLNEVASHHEIFRAVAAAYPQACPQQRKAVVKAIYEYEAPESRSVDANALWPRHRRSAYHHFTWFNWLLEAKPDCDIAQKALEEVRGQYPDFVLQNHPDLTHWHQMSTATSPWSVEELLSRPAAEALPNLLAFQPTDQQRFKGHDRGVMLRAVEDAARNSPAWGLDLADALAKSETWDSDLWPYVITAWTATEFDDEGIRRLLSHLSANELHHRYPRETAKALGELVRRTDKTETTGFLQKANHIATELRPYATAELLPHISSSVGGIPQYTTWLEKAINHAAGNLAQFWIFSIETWRTQQESPSQPLKAEYRNALDAIVGEQNVTGKLGRTVLASYYHFLLAVDESWTTDNLLPFFDKDHQDFQCAWDGFLTWGRLSPTTAEHLRNSTINAIPRVVREFDEHMTDRFIEFYVTAMSWLISDGADDWIVEFFKHADGTAKGQFARVIGHRLRNLDETTQAEWWNVWLKDYWHNRLQGVPSPLDDEEINEMLGWVVALPGAFPEAVDTATKMSKVTISGSLALHNISQSSLLERYPVELARFLVHLGQCETDLWFWHGRRGVVDSLLEKGLPSDIDIGLRELMATHHLS